ncbi:MAG: hypothetical protein WD876_03150 [Candidatus Pacearchaeota archaeon]
MSDENAGAVEGFTLSGEEVFELKDKKFTISAVPYYRDMKSLDKPDQMKRKLIVPVKLSNGTLAEWVANKTSQKVIIAKKGRTLGSWVGFQGEFVIKNQIVGSDEKKVIYLQK